MKSYSVTIQIKASEQYVPAVLFTMLFLFSFFLGVQYKTAV